MLITFAFNLSGGSGHAHKRADSEKFFPTKMRITVIQVSAGSKYDPSLVPNQPRKSGVEDGKKSATETGVKTAGDIGNVCCGNSVLVSVN